MKRLFFILPFSLCVISPVLAEVYITATSGIGISESTYNDNDPSFRAETPFGLTVNGEFEFGEAGWTIEDYAWVKFTSGPLEGFTVKNESGVSISKTYKNFGAKIGISSGSKDSYWSAGGTINDALVIGVSKNPRIDMFSYYYDQVQVLDGHWIYLAYGPVKIHIGDNGAMIASWTTGLSTITLGEFVEQYTWSSNNDDNQDTQVFKFEHFLSENSRVLYMWEEQSSHHSSPRRNSSHRLAYIIDFELFRR